MNTRKSLVRGDSLAQLNGDGGISGKKATPLIRVYPRYVRVRQGSEISYHLKLTRPPTKGKGVTIQVCVIMSKCGITTHPSQLLVTASDWKTPREIRVTSEPDSEIRTIQIHHKIYDVYDEVYNSSIVIPSVFVSVLQKEATFLFSFGCGLHGRLGTNDEQNATIPTPFSCKWLHPVQIACGKAHSAIIDVYSNIYCFGNGANGQLGQGDEKLDHSKLPLRVPTISTGSVLHVACGSNHTFCMTTEGKVYAWGDNNFGQLGLGFKSSKPRGAPTRVEKVVNVRAIVCGGNQSFILTTDSNVLACGSNIAGQLGLGDTKDRVLFERIPFFRKYTTSALSGIAIPSLHHVVGDMDIAVGQYHGMALCGKKVYSWGNGDNGRLGHGDIESRYDPTLISAFKDIPIRFIACGGSHSGAISYSNEVFLWGNGQYGQLGNGFFRDRRIPTRVKTLKTKRVVQLSCGEWHSTGLCEDGTLYSWGFGEEGQLGLPEEGKVSRNVPVPSVIHALSGIGATMVRCGGSHTFVVSVLEARRPQLARLHRRGSRTEHLRGNSRLVMLARHFSKKLSSAANANAAGGSTSRISMATVSEAEETNEQPTQTEPEPATEKTKTRVRRRIRKLPDALRTKQDESREEEPTEPVLPPSATFSWKDRPITSRMAVRNALRQEVRAMAELRESRSPLSTDKRPKSASSLYMSPRMKRLQEQALRTTDVGASMLRCKQLLSGAPTTEIDEAVQLAAESYLRTDAVGFKVDVGPISQAAQQEDDDTIDQILERLRGHEDEDDENAFDDEFQVSGVYDDSGSPHHEDGDDFYDFDVHDEDEEDDVFDGEGSVQFAPGCRAMEADVFRQLRPS